MSRGSSRPPLGRRLGEVAGVDRLVVLSVPLLLPWTLVSSGGTVSLVFPWGLVGAWPPPVHAVSLSQFLLTLTAGLPVYLRAWPYSVVFYACALASTTPPVRRTGWIDDTGTAALLAIAGGSHLLVSAGVWRTGRLALPLGTVLLWTLAYAVYEGGREGGGDRNGGAPSNGF